VKHLGGDAAQHPAHQAGAAVSAHRYEIGVACVRLGEDDLRLLAGLHARRAGEGAQAGSSITQIGAGFAGLRLAVLVMDYGEEVNRRPGAGGYELDVGDHRLRRLGAVQRDQNRPDHRKLLRSARPLEKAWCSRATLWEHRRPFSSNHRCLGLPASSFRGHRGSFDKRAPAVSSNLSPAKL